MKQKDIVYTTFDARAAGGAVKIGELLDQRRASEPPDLLAYDRYLVRTDYENELAVELSACPLLSKRQSGRSQVTFKDLIILGRQLTTILLRASLIPNQILSTLTVRLIILQLRSKHFPETLLPLI